MKIRTNETGRQEIVGATATGDWIGDGLKELGSTFSSAWNGIVSAANAIGGAASDAVNALGSDANNVATWLGEEFKPIASALGSLLKPLTDALGSFAGTDLGHTFLSCIASVMGAALIPFLGFYGPQLATVTFAFPGMVKGDNFAHAWAQEFIWRVQKTADALGADAGKAIMAEVGPLVTQLQAAVPNLGDAASAFSMDPNTIAKQLGVSPQSVALVVAQAKKILPPVDMIINKVTGEVKALAASTEQKLLNLGIATADDIAASFTTAQNPPDLAAAAATLAAAAAAKLAAQATAVANLPTLIASIPFQPNGALALTTNASNIMNAILRVLKADGYLAHPTVTAQNAFGVRKAAYDWLVAHSIKPAALFVQEEPIPVSAIPSFNAKMTFASNGSLALTTANSDNCNSILRAIKEGLYLPKPTVSPTNWVSVRKAVYDWLVAHGIAANLLRILPEPLPVSALPGLLAQITYAPNGALSLTTASSNLVNQIFTILKQNPTASLSAPYAVVNWLFNHGVASARLIPTTPPPTAVAAPAPVAVAVPRPATAPVVLAQAPHLSPDAPELTPYVVPQAAIAAPVRAPIMAPVPTRAPSLPVPSTASPGPAYNRFAERSKWTAYYNQAA